MKKCVFCVGQAKGDSYKGGVITIVEQYLNSLDVFGENDYSTSLLNPYVGMKISQKIKNSKLKNLLGAFEQKKFVFADIKNKNVSVLHMHTSIKWTLLKDMFIARSVRKVFKGKMVLSIHFAEMKKILYKNKILAKYQLDTMKKCFDKIIFLSKETQKEFVAAGVEESKTEVLYTFHNFDYDAPIIKDDKEPLQLLFVGSIDKRKGILDLLNVLKNIDKNAFKLHICGQLTDNTIKEEYETLLKELDDSAIFHGYVSGDKKEEIFKNADVLVLPSYGEGMPIVIMEALAAGCAVISTTVGAIPEIILEKNGRLINPGDRAALETAIIAYVKDRATLNNVKITNYEYGKKFNLENNIVSLCEIYNKK